MNFSFLFKKTESGEMKQRCIVFDLGSLYLKFAFAEKEKNDIRVILWGQEEMNVIFWKRPIEKLWPIIQQSYAAAMQKDGSIRVVLSFSPTFFKAKMLELSLVRKIPELVISSKEEQEIQREIAAKAEQSMKESLGAKLGMRSEEFVPEKLHMLKIRIDGYECSHLQGYRGHTITFLVLGTFLPMEYSKKIRLLSSQYHLGDPLFLHEVEALMVFAKAAKQDGIFADVGERTTQLTVIKKGELAFVEDFPFGSDFFTQSIEKAFGMPENIAREFKEKYAKSTLSDDMRKKIHALFLPEAKKFITLMTEAFEHALGVLPSSLFLYGGGACIPELLESCEGEDGRSLPFLRKPAVSVLLPKNIMNMKNFTQSDNPIYTPLAFVSYATLKKNY